MQIFDIFNFIWQNVPYASDQHWTAWTAWTTSTLSQYNCCSWPSAAVLRVGYHMFWVTK
jgi:hypothetical protein